MQRLSGITRAVKIILIQTQQATARRLSAWWDSSRVAGVDVVFDADFANNRYFNGTEKTFSDLFIESGTSLDADGIHVGVGNTLTLPPKASGDELWTTPTTVDAGWTDNGDGTYTCDGTSGFLRLNGVLALGRSYAVGMTIDAVSAGLVSYPYDGTGETYEGSVGAYTATEMDGIGTGVLYIHSNGFVGTISAVSVQELVPFVGWNSSEGTWVLVGEWAHNGAVNVNILAGDGSTKFMWQSLSQATSMLAYDGVTTISKTGVFTDNTPIAVVMSYLEGGAFNILADGSAEATASLTGDLYPDAGSIDIGHLSGGNETLNFVCSRLRWWPAQFDQATRQQISILGRLVPSTQLESYTEMGDFG